MNDRHPPLAKADLMRNILALLLVCAFVGAMMAFSYFLIPEKNKEIITYMVGQLSGMAGTVLSFYFVNKAGQDALDTKRADNTGKLVDAVIVAQQSPAAAEPDVILEPGETAQAAPAGDNK